MNKVFNKYGAIRYDNGVAGMVDNACQEFTNQIDKIMVAYQLTPVEMRCLSDYIANSVDCFFAEKVLTNAITMKRANEQCEDDNLSDAEADAMTLRDAGWGTDEDYGSGASDML